MRIRRNVWRLIYPNGEVFSTMKEFRLPTGELVKFHSVIEGPPIYVEGLDRAVRPKEWVVRLASAPLLDEDTPWWMDFENVRFTTWRKLGLTWTKIETELDVPESEVRFGDIVIGDQ